MRGLRVLCDQAARRLGDLKRRDRWFGARAASALKDGLARLVGPEHTFAKVMGIILCAALAFLLFGKLSYRVEAPFVLKTDDLAYVPAPFDGYIREVKVKIGDAVKKEAPLLSLDTRELAIEESNGRRQPEPLPSGGGKSPGPESPGRHEGRAGPGGAGQGPARPRALPYPATPT